MTLTELTPLELNGYRFSGDHTPLTPEQIEKIGSKLFSKQDVIKSN